MALESDDQFSRRTAWNLQENALSRALADLRATGRPILDLTRSNPTECGFDYDEKEIKSALSQPKILRYVPQPLGLLSARQAISAYYADLQEHVRAEDLVLTSGT